MSLLSTSLFFTSGLYLSKYIIKKRINKVVPCIGGMSLIYVGSMVEKDNLITNKEINYKRPGYWLIGSGIAFFGITYGTLVHRV
ncbi:hypothetical protein CWI39_1317p0020 [Hamiltosporidium magnivora]|nr:hypothetical protein CWI39_1317p0020 [Hamiltosporidium magnivora]